MGEDIRITVTKKIIMESLISLMKEEDFENITIKEICNKAKISRSTFYSHYEDIYALLANYEKELYQSFELDKLYEKDVNTEFVQKNMMLNILKKVEENKDFYRVYFKNSGSGYMEKAIERLSKNLVDLWLKQEIFEDRTDAEYFFTFYKAGYIAIIKEWLEKPKEKRESAEEMTDTLLLINRMQMK